MLIRLLDAVCALFSSRGLVGKVKGKIHLYSTAFAFGGTVVTDKAGFQPRPQQTKPTH